MAEWTDNAQKDLEPVARRRIPPTVADRAWRVASNNVAGIGLAGPLQPSLTVVLPQFHIRGDVASAAAGIAHSIRLGLM